MVKKIGDKKVGSVTSPGVNATEGAEQVKSSNAIASVNPVKVAGSVGQVSGPNRIGAKRRPTRIMSLADRAQILSLIEEEAQKLDLPPKQRELVERAVKMAVDSGLLPEENNPNPTTDDTDDKNK